MVWFLTFRQKHATSMDTSSKAKVTRYMGFFIFIYLLLYIYIIIILIFYIKVSVVTLLACFTAYVERFGTMNTSYDHQTWSHLPSTIINFNLHLHLHYMTTKMMPTWRFLFFFLFFVSTYFFFFFIEIKFVSRFASVWCVRVWLLQFNDVFDEFIELDGWS